MSLGQRLTREAATRAYQHVTLELKGYPVDQVFAAGSLRRGKPTVGDLDLVLLTRRSLEEFSWPHWAEGGVPYQRMAWFDRPEGRVAVDLWRATPQFLAPMMLFCTGPKPMNQFMWRRAESLGFYLNQWGLWRQSGERVDKEGASVDAGEASIFRTLQLRYLHPRQRDDWQKLWETA